MSVLAINRLPARRLPSLLRHVIGSSLEEVADMQVWECVDTFTVSSERPVKVELDGEVVGSITFAEFEYHADALWVAGPKPP